MSSGPAGLPPRPACCLDATPRRCQHDENDARSKLEQDWTHYSTAQRAQCAGFASLDRAPSYVELLTCLEMAKQVQELPEDSKKGTGER